MRTLLLALALFAISSSTAMAQRARRVDLAVQNADVRNVVQLLAEVGGMNVVFGDEVAGTVTVQFRQVAWDEALRAILETKGLEMVQEGRIVRVASAEVMRRERQARLDARRSCLESAPLRTRYLHPSYANAADIAELVRARLTSRGSVAVDERTNTLIVRDVECP